MTERWRKKPVEVEAVQFTGSNHAEVCTFMGGGEGGADHSHIAVDHPRISTITIGTLEGDMEAIPGDWIIRGVKGEFYPCKPDIFEATYERVEADR